MSRRNRNTTAFSLFAFQDIITSVTGIMILVTLILALELLTRKIGSPAVQTAQVTAAMQEAVETSEELQKQVEENKATVDRIRQALAAGEQNLREAAPHDIRDIEDQINDLQHINEELNKQNQELDENREEAERRIEEVRAFADDRKDDSTLAKEMRQQAEEKRKELQKLKSTNAVVYNAADGSSKSAWLVEISAGRLSVGPMDRSSPTQQFASVNAFQAWAAKRNRNTEYFVLLLKPDGISEYPNVQKALRALGFDIGSDLLGSDQSAVDASGNGGTQ